MNPDGQQMVVDWYKKNVGTAYEGSPLPWLYHPYAGHDNNRDLFMFNLIESRHAAKILYHEWFPEIVYDQHQMGYNGPRLFMPPYEDPINPNVPSTLLAEVNMLGKHVVADLHSQGYKGIVTGMVFNSYFEGTMSKTPLWHNMVGILSEMASTRIATPLYFPRGSLGKYGAELPRYSRVSNFLDPWPGGWWRMRDIIDYEKAVTFSILDLVATYKNKFKTNFYSLNKEAIHKGKTEAPFAYIIPSDQHDPNSAEELLKRLQLNGVQIYAAKIPFTYKNVNYAAGTFIIPLSQPNRSCIKDLMEVQVYPDLDLYPGGPPKPPYDVTAWTLPLQMGVKSVAMNDLMNIALFSTETFNFDSIEKITDKKTKNYFVERRYNHSFKLINTLLEKGFTIYWSNEIINHNGDALEPGTFIIPAEKDITSILDELSQDLKVPVYGSNQALSIKKTQLRQPRVGMYQPWRGNMDEGWTRLLIDNFYFSYANLHNKDIKKGSLADNFNAIILPNMSLKAIIKGSSRRRNEKPVLGQPKMPPEYRGGIGKKGVAALREFVEEGGTLITFGDASMLAIDSLRVPARNALQDLEEKDFYSPGALLQIELDKSQTLAYGMPRFSAIQYTNNPAFDLMSYTQESKAIGFYNDGNPLLSGWIRGHEKLAGKTALAEIPVKKGRVIMFGFRVQNRAQTFGTFKLLFNAILSSNSQVVPIDK
jgi:hypothetical protein